MGGAVPLHMLRSAEPDPVDIAALLGPAAWARLSPAVRRRFAVAHGTRPVTYPGRMAFRRSAMGLLFALAAKLLGAPLPLRRAADCPTDVTVSADGRGGVVWARRIRFPAGPPQQVISTKRLGTGRHRGQLLECVRGGLGMVLDVAAVEGGLAFTSRRYFLALGPTAIPLPHLVTPGRCTVTHTDAGPGRFRFTLVMRHTLWGETFRQDGLFDEPETLA